MATRPRRTTVGPGQYTSFRFTTHLVDAGIDACIGTVGDALDNALMESAIGLYKTELIKPRGPWKNLAGVEMATAEGSCRWAARRSRSSRKSMFGIMAVTGDTLPISF